MKKYVSVNYMEILYIGLFTKKRGGIYFGNLKFYLCNNLPGQNLPRLKI